MRRSLRRGSAARISESRDIGRPSASQLRRDFERRLTRLLHGADLEGLCPVPGIAGRSPSYLVRQMFDMQAGARHGEWTKLMAAVVAKLTDDDLVNIAAYVSSRRPAAGTAP